MTTIVQSQERLEEIYEINRRFLHLISMRAQDSGERHYGLPACLCRRIAALSAIQCEAMAMVPLLLVTVASRAVSDASRVRDMEDVRPQTYRMVDVAEQNFMAALMIWLSQKAQQDHTLASLWQGVPDAGGKPACGLSFGEIQSLAPFAGRILRARLVDRPNVWADLIESVRSSDPRRQRLARLAVLPHSCPVRKSPPEALRRQPPRK